MRSNSRRQPHLLFLAQRLPRLLVSALVQLLRSGRNHPQAALVAGLELNSNNRNRRSVLVVRNRLCGLSLIYLHDDFTGTSTSTAGGFGATPSFGGTSTAGSTLFGAKPATTQSTGFSFGAPAASSAPSGFGATPATVGFGLGGTSSAGAGLFGAKPGLSS